MSTTIINKAYMLFHGDETVPPEVDRVESHKVQSVCKDTSINVDQKLQFAQLLESTATKPKDVIKRQDDKTDGNCSEEVETVCQPTRKQRRIPRYISENIFVITFVWQLVCVVGLEAVDGLTRDEVKRKEKWYFIIVIVIMVILQLINMFACLSVTIKLFKQYRHNNTSMKFLLRCYIAILFLFGGVYTFIAWMFPITFVGIRDNKDSKIRTLNLYSQMVFTSISTGTLCGSASINASHLVTETLMSLQMLLSFLYFTTILSEVVNPFKHKFEKRVTVQNEVQP